MPCRRRCTKPTASLERLRPKPLPCLVGPLDVLMQAPNLFPVLLNHHTHLLVHASFRLLIWVCKTEVQAAERPSTVYLVPFTGDRQRWKQRQLQLARQAVV